MSLSPLTHENAEPLEMIQSVGISKPRRSYKIGSTTISTKRKSELKDAVVEFAGGGNIFKNPDGEFMDVGENTTFISTSGVFRCTKSGLYGNTWDFCTIAIELDNGVVLHKGFKSDCDVKLEGVNIRRVSISKLVPMHGPTVWMDDIPSLLINSPAHSTLVGYRPQRSKRGMLNVAFSVNKKLICIVCRREFDNQAEWSSHTRPIPEPPMPGDGWHRIYLHERGPIISPNIFIPRCGKTLESFTERSLADQSMYGTVRSLWNSMMCSLSRNNQDMFHCWSRVQPTQENFEKLITDIVHRARDRWEQERKRKR
jgi:hypothetical protein